MTYRCAPRADIGLWRTTTFGTAHITGTPVRLFGGPEDRLASILDYAKKLKSNHYLAT